jgi:hypothetical protein
MRNATGSPSPSRHGSRLSLALAGVGCVLAISACGSSGSPSSAAGTGSGDALALKFANCMRSHGVPNFPDPGKPVGGPGSGINAQAPAVQSAEQNCDKLTHNPEPKGSPASESQRRAALANAQCMRTHGVPNFPDPTFPSTGGMSVNLAGLNPQSPAFEHAQAACPFPPHRG